jgi:predicted TIM-barrel fold metal-dependent hydrolase
MTTEIVDAHHHLWDLEENEYPWLTTEADSIPLPDFQKICRNYLIEDFREDARHQSIVKSVHVQAEHDESDPVRETAWLQRIADDPASGGFPHAIVAFADLSLPNAEAILEAHRQFPNLRGIRQSLNHTPGPDGDVAAAMPRRDLLADEAWQRGFGLLRRYDLSFDMQIFPWQAEAGVRLAMEHADTPIVLDHTGMPVDRSEEGLALWRRAMRALARCPNLSVKISGLGMAADGWNEAQVRLLIDETLELFGPERCLFASNFPVDKLMVDYDTLWNTFREATSGLSADERQALFRGNAERFYRI